MAYRNVDVKHREHSVGGDRYFCHAFYSGCWHSHCSYPGKMAAHLHEYEEYPLKNRPAPPPSMCFVREEDPKDSSDIERLFQFNHS